MKIAGILNSDNYMEFSLRVVFAIPESKTKLDMEERGGIAGDGIGVIFGSGWV